MSGKHVGALGQLTENEKKFVGKELVKLRSFATFTPKPVNWLWYPYIPRGKVTILQGDPGGGKTALTMSLLAKMSRLKDNESINEKSSFKNWESCRLFCYQTAEDGIEDTIIPRLAAYNADLRKISCITAQDLALTDGKLEYVAMIHQPEIIVLDPIQAFLGADLDMHRANEIRPVMKYLAELAEVSDTAILLVGHLNKKSGDNELYRGLGSIDLVAAARSVMLMMRNPKRPEERILKHIKSSLAKPANQMKYAFDDSGRIYCQGIYTDEKHPKVVERSAEKVAFAIRTFLGNESKPVQELRRYLDEKIGGYSAQTWSDAKRLAQVEVSKTKTGWLCKIKEGADFGGENDDNTEENL